MLFAVDLEIGNNRITDSILVAIRLLGIQGLDVHHNAMTGNGGGVGFVRNNAIHETTNHPAATGILVNATAGVTVERNSVIGTRSTGVAVVNSSDCQVLRNNIVRNGGDGLIVVLLSNCVLSQNTVHRNGRNGIFLMNIGAGNLVSSNSASGNDPGRDPNLFDCNWDGSDAPVFLRNACRTENPPGVWD